MAAARREPSPRRGTAVRRTLAGLLVALVTALVPLGSTPAGAAQLTSRAGPAAASAITTTAPASATRDESRRGVRTHRAKTSGRRLADRAQALPAASGQRGGQVHVPLLPGTGSADPTGPPPAYAVTIVRTGDHPPGGCHYPAAAGRAPPSSCGS